MQPALDPTAALAHKLQVIKDEARLIEEEKQERTRKQKEKEKEKEKEGKDKASCRNLCWKTSVSLCETEGQGCYCFG